MKKILPHVISIVVLVILSCVFFYPQIQGEKIIQSDITNYKGMASEIREWQEKTGHTPLWTNVMFGGMPTYQISSAQPGNFARYIEDVFQLFIARPIGYFIACSICMYIMLICLGCSPWIAVIGAIGYTYTTAILSLYEAGHTSKMRVLSFIPLITAGVILAYRKKYLVGSTLFLMGAAVALFANHPQMLYYASFPLIFYVIMKAIDGVKEKEIMGFSMASLGLVIGLVIALGCSATLIFTTADYVEATTRGDIVLKQQVKSESGVNHDGLQWDYAMMWSQNWQDVMTLIIPGAAGGGSMEPAAWSEAMQNDRIWSQVMRNNGGKAPLYHGGLPFTSGPAYLGILFILFFILGYFIKGGKFYHWILISTLFTIFLSMGKNMEWFNRILFNYVPLFDKFRTPNSIMPITSLLMAMGGAVGLKDFFQSKFKVKEKQRKLYLSTGISIGLCLVAWMVSASYGFEAAGDARFTGQGLNIEPLLAARSALLRGDVFRNIILILLAAVGLLFNLKGKISKKPVLIGLAVLTLFDIWGVGKRYINADTFKRERIVENQIQPREVDKRIMKDPDPYFRVYDLSINTFNSSTSSNFYKTIGGYHAAKLQRYQDLIDYHIQKGNMKVLNMLNTKYIITQQGELKQNPAANGNAWFVKDIKVVESNMQEIIALNTTNLKNTAVINDEFTDELKYSGYSQNGTVQLTYYSPEKLVYKSSNQGNGLVVFSEIWYGPDKGWKAYIDGEEVPLFRVNYALRGIEVPAGQHEIEMKFHPQAYYAGLTVSYISSILMLLAIIAVIYVLYRRKTQSS